MEKIGNIHFHGDRKKKQIALTFDDGPSKETHEILKLLKREKIRATFFVLGKKVRGNEKLLKEIVKNGSEIGNHSFDHSVLMFKTKKKIEGQIRKTDRILQKLNIKTRIIRPPRILFGPILIHVGKKLNKKIIIYDVDPADWTRPGKNIIIKRVLNGVKNGSIIGCHDFIETIGRNYDIVSALKEIIPQLKKRGYKFVTVSEIIKR
ncbi:MAG: polysaccharide deacetylase family protein [Candidatus Pacearchaeota archaeon]|nr:polysaccharide deacetylase family protein [Candidatus Pacearchaeota archaeon]